MYDNGVMESYMTEDSLESAVKGGRKHKVMCFLVGVMDVAAVTAGMRESAFLAECCPDLLPLQDLEGRAGDVM